MKRVKLKQNRILLFVFIFLFAIGKGTSWSICVNNYKIYVYAVFSACLLFYCVKKKKIIGKDFKSNFYPWLLLLAIFPSILISDFNINLGSNAIFVLGVMAVYFLTLNFSKDELIAGYVDVIYFIAIISIICYVLFNIFNAPSDWMLHLSKSSDLSGESFKSIIIYSIRILDSKRNCGPFWEPSIFAFYLIVAFLLEKFYLNSQNIKKEIVLFVSLITTFSTGGLVMIMIVFVIWIWNNRRYSFLSFVLSIMIVLGVVFGLDLLQDYLLLINYSLFSKLFFFSSNKSSMSRIYSVLINLEIWKSSPIFGVGQVNVDRIYHLVSKDIVPIAFGLNPSQSATPFIFLASFGIGGLFYSWCWIKAVITFIKFNKIQKFFFGALIFFSLIEVPHTNFLLTYFILFSLLHIDINKVNNVGIKGSDYNENNKKISKNN